MAVEENKIGNEKEGTIYFNKQMVYLDDESYVMSSPSASSDKSTLGCFTEDSIFDTPIVSRVEKMSTQSEKPFKDCNTLLNFSSIIKSMNLRDVIPDMLRDKNERESEHQSDTKEIKEHLCYRDEILKVEKFIYRMPGEIVNAPSIKVEHMVTGNEGAIFYFKISALAENKNVEWYVKRHFEYGTTLSQVEKDLVDLNDAPRLLNNFVNTYVVKYNEIHSRTQYLYQYGKCVETKLLNNKMLLYDHNGIVVKGVEIKSVKAIEINHYNLCIKRHGYVFIVNDDTNWEFETLSEKERTAWMDELISRINSD